MNWAGKNDGNGEPLPIIVLHSTVTIVKYECNMFC